MLKLNEHKVEVTLFPDHTSQVWKIDPALLLATSFKIEWDFDSESELLHLAQLKALLDTTGRSTQLHIRYLPYARQDKMVGNDATFALRPFASLLNSLNFDSILIDDPHSAVATQLIERAVARYPSEKVARIAKRVGADLVCYPDKGARLRYSTLYPFDSIYGEKVRNQLTGQITSYQVEGHAAGKRILIIDDICDGGATFVLLAQELLRLGAVSVDLFVTHGLFSKGLKPLHQSGIRHVFTQHGEAFETQQNINYKEILS